MISHLVVRAGRSLLALPSTEILRVLRGMPIYPAPGVSRHVLGLSRFGGEALVVYTLESLAGLQELPWSSSLTLLVIHRKQEKVGVAVREAIEVVELPEINGVAPPSEEVGEYRRLVQRINFDILFDPERLKKPAPPDTKADNERGG